MDEEDTKGKEETRPQEWNEAAARLMQVYGAKIRSQENERMRQEKKRQKQDELKQAMYKAYMKREIEQITRRLELLSLQNEQRILAFPSEERSQQKKSAEHLFLTGLKKHKVTKNLDLLNDLRRAFALTPLSSYPDKPYNEMELMEKSEDYIRASAAFRTRNMRFFTISKIVRVDNTFHVLQYHLMQDKYRNRYAERCLSEQLMFHGTKREYLDSICTNNFDRSKVSNHKFGHGVSFAKESFYATHYHRDNKRNNHKVMVVAQVFFRPGFELSTANMVVPRGSCYTSANADRTVIVKYDDASFYPLYIIYYYGVHPMYMKKGAKKGLS